MDKYVEKGKFNSKKWIANNTVPIEESVNEAEMDKKFAKEFESSCNAFINHIKHELKTAESSDAMVLRKMLKALLVVSGYPKLMSRIVGEK